MSEPHIEVLSRNRISRSTVILGVIPVTLFSGLLVFALWQFLFWIAIGVLALLSIGALYLIAIALIDVRRRWIHAHVVHLGEHGVVDAVSWRMLPLALPAPHVTVREDKETEAELDKNIIDLWKGGRHSYRAIAEDLKTNYPRVQKVLADYKKQQGIA